MLVMLCAGSVIVLIYFLSSWDVKVSTKELLSSYKRNVDSTDNNHIITNNKPAAVVKKEPVVYKNPDGSDMAPKSIFMIRDFGRSECEHAFNENGLSAGIKEERERNRDQNWNTINREDAWGISLGWKKHLKEILPNFKDYSAGWVGQGVVLTAFFREGGDDRETMIEDLLLQIKILRGLSTIPIEVWFESMADVTGELHQSLAEWGTLIRALDDDSSTSADAFVEETPENDNVIGTTDPAITLGDIEDFKAKDPSPAQIQKALTVAALINSGFEDIIFYSPTTLPLQSPRVVFQQDQFVQTGAVFWQHPTVIPAHDNPIWPIIQSDCIPEAHVQSWSAVALKHKESWKGLFVAWEWLTGKDMDQFESFLGSQGNDLLRMAWMAVKRQYAMVDRMPEAGLVDMSQTKGSGVGCNLGSHLYPVPGSTILIDLKQHAQDLKLQQKMFQQSQRYGLQGGFFLENTSVMMVDTSRESCLLSLEDTISNDRHLNSALDSAMTSSRDTTKLLLADGYAAGPGGRVCVRISRQPKGHRHDV